MIIYHDTDRELYYVPDYKPLPDNINMLTKTELKALYDNIAAAYDNAFIYHSELLLSALYNDILTVSKQMGKKGRKDNG